jgi:uncharacterized membrane protein
MKASVGGQGEAHGTGLGSAHWSRTYGNAGSRFRDAQDLQMTENESSSSKVLDRTFEISVTLKGLDALLEVIGGLVLLFVAPSTLQAWTKSLTTHELAQDPHDFVARHLLHSASQLSHGTTLFAAVYLLSHGIAKIVLVVAVLRGQLWAYPWMIALLGVFIIYQVYRMTYRLSLGLLLLTLFDAFVVVLTVIEYRRRRKTTPQEIA